MKVEIDDLSYERADEIVATCSVPEGLPLRRSPRPWVIGRKAPPRLYVSESYEGRDVLSSSANWNASTWAMDPDLVPRLAETLRCLCNHVAEGFVFFAGWPGDDDRERMVLCHELVELVLASGLHPKTRYRVLASPGGPPLVASHVP